MRDHLDKLLAEIDEEINKHTHLDEERRQHLRELANHIEARLNDDPDTLLSGDSQWSLQESVVQFEDEFPRLAALFREVQQVLVNIGV